VTRFSELIESRKPKGKSGLDFFAGDACSLCGVKFDRWDALYWSQTTGKCHYRCYAEWRLKQ
jgi:hypothetical protein